MVRSIIPQKGEEHAAALLAITALIQADKKIIGVRANVLFVQLDPIAPEGQATVYLKRIQLLSYHVHQEGTMINLRVLRRAVALNVRRANIRVEQGLQLALHVLNVQKGRTPRPRAPLP